MTHTLESYNGTISIGGCKITNPRFADGNDGITGEEDDLTKFVQNLDTADTKFGNEDYLLSQQNYRGESNR